MKWGNVRNELIEICIELGIEHREFVSYQDTRFAEYRHRTYKVFIHMHLPLYRLSQKKASSDTPEALDSQERVLGFQNPEACLKLVFMYEISQLLTRTQKHCQDQNLLPPERKQKIEAFVANLRAAHSSFLSTEIPETLEVRAPQNSEMKPWSTWKFLKEKLQVEEKHTFQGVPTLMPGQQGRKTRNVAHNDKADIRKIVCPAFAKFIGSYLSELEKYFFPWPKWLSLTEDVFIWNNDLEDSFDNRLSYRLSSLDKLMKCPMAPEPIAIERAQLFREQYKTFCQC